MPIISFGIILPNGRFLPNSGDGHCKNAVRFCEEYSELNDMRKNENILNPDEFLLSAGCAIIAGYRGRKCIKVARNNDNPIIKRMIKTYQESGYEVWLYWNINPDYKKILDKIIALMPKMELVKKEYNNEVWVYCRRKVLS